MNSLNEISEILSTMKKEEISKFFNEILTPAEVSTLSKRWRIVTMLASGKFTQREIAQDLGVSLCKVTRGSKILKTQNAVTRKFIKGERNDIKCTTNN